MHIFRMRSGGYRLPGSSILGSGVSGWLDYRQSPPDDYGPRWEAHLRATPGGPDLLVPLLWAKVRRIDGVLHLAGREECGRRNTKAKSELRHQSWLCAINAEDAEPLIARIRLNTFGFSDGDSEDDLRITPLD